MQAEQLAERLETLALDARLHQRPSRAAETAEIIGAGRGIPIVHDPGLREIDVGSWSGLTRDEIEERFPGPRPSTTANRATSTSTACERAVERIAAQHAGERVLIVSHGGSIRTLRRHALQVDSVPPVENCTVYRLAFEGGSLRGID